MEEDEKHVWLYEGSKEELEKITGEAFEFIKNADGNRLFLSWGAGFSNELHGKKRVESMLGVMAKTHGADALVETTHSYTPHRYSPDFGYCSGYGYAVVKKK